MSHPEQTQIVVTVSPEQAKALNTAIACYQLWIEQHQMQSSEFRGDIPLLEEVKRQLTNDLTPVLDGRSQAKFDGN